ncbi:Putative ribonuclease H protein At1g65750 [Linum grandiflorum]
MLGKWAWRFAAERASRWRRLIECKCNSRVSEWQSTWHFGSVGGSLWRWIVQESSYFWKFRFFDPGGGWVSFWEDFWVQDVRLSSSFPRIAASAKSLDLSLFSCICFDGRVRYDTPLRFQLHGGALDEGHAFQSYLGRLPIPITTVGPARVVWPLLPLSSFSVNSLMAALKCQAFPGVDEFLVRCIWSKEVPTKVQGFLWLVWKWRILTMENLRRRGLIAPNSCSLCQHNVELVSHIFLSCRFSCRVWKLFSSILSIFGPLHHDMPGVMMGWKAMNCFTSFQKVMSALLYVFCWCVWLEGNHRFFRDEF